MKVKINHYGREEKFYGLKKLQFHSQNNDKSQLRERLGYWFFKEMGVPSPRSVHANLYINGEYFGVYGLTEQIDGRFAKQNFDDSEGNIYKEVWPLNFEGQVPSDEVFKKALKTNEEIASIGIIKNFAQQIADSDERTIKKIISNGIEIDELISYIAVDRLIRHDDGPFHWYCSEKSCTNHNYYWYEEPSNKKLHLIPWDLDVAFSYITTKSNGVNTIADKWGQKSGLCEPYIPDGYRFLQWSASCEKLTSGFVLFNEEYKKRTRYLQENLISKALENIDIWSEQIRDDILIASQSHNDYIYQRATSMEEWLSAIQDLKEQVRLIKTMETESP